MLKTSMENSPHINPKMNLLDKAYVLISPKEPFWKYLSLHLDSLDELKSFHSPSLYLINEDCWDEEEWVSSNYQRIAAAESSLFIDPERNVLGLESFEQFKTYFSYQLGDVVFDSTQKR